MNQQFSIVGNLDKLMATLDCEEDGKRAVYEFDLESDRSACLITRTLYPIEGGDAVGEQTWIRDLEAVKDDPTLPDVVMWLSRGLWGIPLRFGLKEESPVIPGEIVSL